jgi:hypothetical protein
VPINPSPIPGHVTSTPGAHVPDYGKEVPLAMSTNDTPEPPPPLELPAAIELVTADQRSTIGRPELTEADALDVVRRTMPYTAVQRATTDVRLREAYLSVLVATDRAAEAALERLAAARDCGPATAPSMSLQTAVDLVAADYRDAADAPEASRRQAIVETRTDLRHDDIDSTVDDRQLLDAYYMVLDASDDEIEGACLTTASVHAAEAAAGEAADPWRPPAVEPARGRETGAQPTPEADDPRFSGDLLNTGDLTNTAPRDPNEDQRWADYDAAGPALAIAEGEPNPDLWEPPPEFYEQEATPSSSVAPVADPSNDPFADSSIFAAANEARADEIAEELPDVDIAPRPRAAGDGPLEAGSGQRCAEALRAADEAISRIDQVTAEADQATDAERTEQVNRWSAQDRTDVVEQDTSLDRELF